MSKTIVYYVVSPVHLRNAQLIAQEMPEWTFRVVYEPYVEWFNTETLAKVPLETVALVDDKTPDVVWSGDVRCVIFSTTQPRPAPINLLHSALKHGVPTLAIEESNQIALNRGTVNNYLLPVDYVLTASKYEQREIIEAGWPRLRVEATGWPFYAGKVGKTEPNLLRTMKKRFALDPNRPVATLTLTGLNDAGESPTVRRRQLTLAAQGLPPEYQLVVKPHPIENLEILMPFLTECAPHAKAIEGLEPIHEVLEATDVLLNRGVSQVCIEALYREIPVIILDTGVQTPFHRLTEDLIIKQPSDLGRALEQLFTLPDSMQLYTPFRQEHVPYSPQRARELTCQRIAQIAEIGPREQYQTDQWFDLALYQAWPVNRSQSLNFWPSEHVCDSDLPVNALQRLIQYQATRSDLETLRQYLGPGFRSHILRSLWIDQLYRRHARPTAADIEWLQDFPPSTNNVWFLQQISRWIDLLLRSGQGEEALTLAQKLEQDFIHVPRIPNLVRDVRVYHAGLLGRGKYFFHHLEREMRVFLRPTKQKLKSKLRRTN